MNGLSKLDDIQGVTVSTEKSAVKAFNKGRINMLVIPLELSPYAVEVMATISTDKAYANTKHFQDKFKSQKRNSPIEFAGDADMIESNLFLDIKNAKLPLKDLHKGIKALYQGHTSSEEAVDALKGVTKVFQNLVRPEHNHANLHLAYCFDPRGYGLPTLPDDAADLARRAELRASGRMLESTHKVEMNFSLLSPMGYVLASDTAKTDWTKPHSYAGTDDVVAIDTKCQQAAIDKVGGAELPFPAIVLSRPTENGPVLMGPSPNSATRSVTGRGFLYHLLPKNN